MKYRIKATADGNFHAQVRGPFWFWDDIGSIADNALIWDGLYPVVTEERARELIAMHKSGIERSRRARTTIRVIEP